MEIITRAEWGARAPTRPPVMQKRPSKCYLHHSVGYGRGGAAYMRQMQRQHIEDNGWRDIAYNFVLDPADLKVYEGRGGLVVPGAQKGFNIDTIAVCVMGNFQTTNPNWRVIETLVNLQRLLYVRKWAPMFYTGGHRDAPGQSTQCPGNFLHARIPEINALIAAPAPTEPDMRYRNFINVPYERDAQGNKTVARWAAEAIDNALADGRVRAELEYDYDEPISIGRYIVMEDRLR